MQGGIQFFPLDTNLDTKLQLIECEYGLKGFAVIIKLWQKIYGGEGYFIEWNKDVALLFGRELGLSYEAVSEIINAAIRRGIFCAQMAAEHGILTSSGIQKRFFEATRRRKETIIKKEFLLVRVEQIPQNVHILENKVNRNQKNVDEFNQIKKERNEIDDDDANPIEIYLSLFGNAENIVKTELNEIQKKLPLPVIKYILELAKVDGKKWNWIKTVLRNAIKDGVKSVEGFEAIREQYSIKRRTEKKITAKNAFTSYASNAEYDFEEFEKRALEKRIKESECTKKEPT